MPVPHVAAWSTETAAVGDALTTRPARGGLAYRDEVPDDRDRNGVLWARLAWAPGVGRPDFRTMHSRRQRRAMLGMLCQVCDGPASRTSRGWLFLLQRPEGTEETAPGWPEGGLSTKPPVCEPCAHLALRWCPHLTDPIAVRSRKPRVWGVFGGLFAPTADGLAQSPTDHCLPYGHPAAPWFLASQLVIELGRCTEVRLNAEPAA